MVGHHLIFVDQRKIVFDFEIDMKMFYLNFDMKSIRNRFENVLMENFGCCSTTFEYKGFVKRKISPICYMIGNLLIHETVLIYLIEL